MANKNAPKRDKRQIIVSTVCIVIVAALLLTSLISIFPIYN